MIEAAVQFNRVAIEPTACLAESWQRLKPQYWVFFAITLVGLLLANMVPFGILAGPMFCGIYGAWFCLSRGETLRFEMLFKGFDHFAESLVATLILVGAALVVVVPVWIVTMGIVFMGAASAEQGNEAIAGSIAVAGMLLLGLVLFALMVVVAIATVFIYPLIVDRGLAAVPAIKTSIAAGWAHFGGLLALVLIIGLLSLAAMLLCYLPVFLVAPWSFGALGVAYRRVFPEKDGDLSSQAHNEARGMDRIGML